MAGIGLQGVGGYLRAAPDPADSPRQVSCGILKDLLDQRAQEAPGTGTPQGTPTGRRVDVQVIQAPLSIFCVENH